MSTQYIQYPSNGTVISKYTTFSAFPSIAPNGTLAIALDTGDLYEYNTNTGMWQLIGPSSGGIGSIGPFGSAPNADGGSISGSTLTLQPASGSFPGGVSTTTQTFAGTKTFSGQIITQNGSISNPGIVVGTNGGGFYNLGSGSVGYSDGATNWIQLGSSGMKIQATAADPFRVAASISDSSYLATWLDGSGNSFIQSTENAALNIGTNSSTYLGISSLGVINIPNLTASTAVATDASKNLVSSTTTATELGYVHGVTSSIQTQLGLLAPLASPTFTGTINAASLQLTGTLGVEGTPAASNQVNIRGQSLTGVSQLGLLVNTIFQSGATSSASTITGTYQSAAATYTTILGSVFNATAASIGAGNTVTRLVNYFGSQPTAGTNNAFLADNTSFTGNYFLNSQSTTMNRLDGGLGIGTNPSSTVPLFIVGGAASLTQGQIRNFNAGGSVGFELAGNPATMIMTISNSTNLASLMVANTNFLLGTNSAFGLNLETNSITNLSISSAGLITLGGSGGTQQHALNTATSATATAGAATLPAAPVGFITITINGTTGKIPFYAS